MKKKSPLAIVVISLATLGFASYAGAGCGEISPAPAATSAAAEAVVTLHIEGMTCGSCAIAVKRVLTKVNGVKAATVSYEKKNAVVTYDASSVSPQAIARAVEEKLPTYKAKVVQ